MDRLDPYNHRIQDKIAELVAIAAGAEEEALDELIDGVLEGFPATDKERVAVLAQVYAARHREAVGFQAILRRAQAEGPALEVVG